MLISAENIKKSYTEKILLNGVSLYLDQKDKIGVIGVNGTGKSTLLKIIAGYETPDQGTVNRTQGTRVEYLPQIPLLDDELTITDQVLLGTEGETRLEKLHEARNILNRLGLSDHEQIVGELSGGQKKRVAIAASLLHPSDVLILDEPTNHLDNDMVVWLENYLGRYKGAIIMITHDRYFLDRVANKIVEISQGSLYTYPGNYSTYLEMKAQREEIEEGTRRKRKSFLRQELEWIKRGPLGRGTKSRHRMEQYEKIKSQDVRAKETELELKSIERRLGKKIIELDSVSKSFEDKLLIEDFSYFIERNSRIGIVGSNGSGKSTLLNMISGRLVPDKGRVIVGDTVSIGYFSQHSEELDQESRVIDYIRNISEVVRTPDGEVTATKLLERFLFTPDQQWTYVKKLSGGEQRRLYLLSILIAAPNVLLLDEPTNDLDIETLTILEDYLEDFKGAVIVVSHDRYFLEKVTDRILVMSDQGIIEYLGSYLEYLEENKDKVREKPSTKENLKKKPERKEKETRKLKLSFNEQQDLLVIDDQIAGLEEEIGSLEKKIAEETSNYELLQELLGKKTKAETLLEQKMERWVYLHSLVEKIEESKNGNS